MQTLVYENYNKFIAATETIRYKDYKYMFTINYVKTGSMIIWDS
jgi:hypothetical protein